MSLHSSAELVEEAARLESRILALQTQIVERAHDGLATALATERVKARDAVEKYTTIKAAHDDKAGKLDEANDERNKLVQRIEEFECQVGDIMDQIAQHEVMEKKLTEQKSKFEQQSLILEDELAKYKERYEALCEELELVYLQKDDMSAELASVKSKLDVSKTVHALKLDQFQGMMKANLEVADSIKSLMTKIDLDVPTAPGTLAATLGSQGGAMTSALLRASLDAGGFLFPAQAAQTQQHQSMSSSYLPPAANAYDNGTDNDGTMQQPLQSVPPLNLRASANSSLMSSLNGTLLREAAARDEAVRVFFFFFFSPTPPPCKLSYCRHDV